MPSPRSRWCTRQLKIRPFEKWIEETVKNGGKVVSYVAIRADEPYREGYNPSAQKGIEVKMPFRTDGIDKKGVMQILDEAGVGTPQQVATEWCITLKALEKWRFDGTNLPFMKMGNGPKSIVRYRRKDVVAFIEAHMRNSTSEFQAATVANGSR